MSLSQRGRGKRKGGGKRKNEEGGGRRKEEGRRGEGRKVRFGGEVDSAAKNNAQ